MIRHRLTDGQWGRIAHLIPGKPGDPGRTTALEAVRTKDGLLCEQATSEPLFAKGYGLATVLFCDRSDVAGEDRPRIAGRTVFNSQMSECNFASRGERC
jgi:hypothetical protein